MHARLYAIAEDAINPDVDKVPGPPPAVRQDAYSSIDELLADLDVVDASLRTHGGAALADAQVEPAGRAAAIFGAHLCGLDMRQISSVHEGVIADLQAIARVHREYLDWRKLTESRC